MGIGLPVRRLPPAGDDYGRPIPGPARLCLDCRRQMHGERHRADGAVGVVHQTDELADVRLSHQIDDSREPRMPVIGLSALHELDAAPEMIDNLLIACRVPPLGGEIELASRQYDPERALMAGLLHLAHPGLFQRREVDVPLEFGERDANSQLVFKELCVAVDKMIGCGIAAIDQGIVHADDTDIPFVSRELGDPWVMFPKRARRGVDGRQVFAGMGTVEIPDSRGQHDHIAGTESAFQQQLLGCVRHAWSLDLSDEIRSSVNLRRT